MRAARAVRRRAIGGSDRSAAPGEREHARLRCGSGPARSGTADRRRENYLQTQHSTRPALEAAPVEATSLETQPASPRCALSFPWDHACWLARSTGRVHCEGCECLAAEVLIGCPGSGTASPAGAPAEDLAARSSAALPRPRSRNVRPWSGPTGRVRAARGLFEHGGVHRRGSPRATRSLRQPSCDRSSSLRRGTSR